MRLLAVCLGALQVNFYFLKGLAPNLLWGVRLVSPLALPAVVVCRKPARRRELLPHGPGQHDCDHSAVPAGTCQVYSARDGQLQAFR